MFTIGDFARYGQVSVRMLRHYDAIGLLRPAHVDPGSGYRFYEAAQLARLNRIIALKDLGFGLPQVKAMLDEELGVAEMRGMLRMRRAELEATIATHAGRLAGVEARLRTIENEGQVPADDVVVKPIAPVRVAELTSAAASMTPEDIGPVIQPLYHELFTRLAAAELRPAGPHIAYYDDSGASEAVVVHGAVPVAVDSREGHDFVVVDLPEVSAATVVHRGLMDSVLPTWQALAHWIDRNGYRSAGPGRELYLACPGEPEQVTELQQPVTRP